MKILIEDITTFEFRDKDVIIDLDDEPWWYYDGKLRCGYSVLCKLGVMKDGWLTPTELSSSMYAPYYLIYRCDAD